MRKIGLSILLLMMLGFVRAQTPDTAGVYNSYVDLNVAMLEGNIDQAISLTNTIMPDSAALPVKARINYYNIIGKLHEDSDAPEAIKYYSRVAAAVPNYYVVHRALGYLYVKQVQNSKAVSIIKKAIFHLEKAEACDPSTETLELIQSLYKQLNDDAGLKTLDKRLADKAKVCVDLLETE